MTSPLHYQSPERAALAGHWWPAAVLVAAACVVAAGCAWARSTPSLGERALPAIQVWAARCTAASLWAAGQAVLLGVALPAIYRPRPTYSGLAALSGLVATLCAVSAGALWLAGR
jgi:hypothetical protein